MFKKILVPTDGSDKAIQAAEVAKNIAQKYNAKIILLHVMQPNYNIPSFGTVETIPVQTVSIADIAEMDKTVLQRTLGCFADTNIAIEMRSEWGHPVERIVAVASEEAADLIVIGNRGMSGLEEFLLGGVSNKVVHEAVCPVLIVK